MRKVLLPVIVGILILGLLGSQDAFSAIKISGNDPIDPILKPINFTVFNTGKNPITVTAITVFVADPNTKQVTEIPIESVLLPRTLPSTYGTSFDADLPPGVEIGKKTFVSITAVEEEPNPRDADNPKMKKVKAKKKLK